METLCDGCRMWAQVELSAGIMLCADCWTDQQAQCAAVDDADEFEAAEREGWGE